MKNQNNNELFFYPEVKEDNKRIVIAGVVDPETNILHIGRSECSPKDRFDKAKGRAIALGRARCVRPLKEKEFVHKGRVLGTNQALLPRVYQLESDKSILHQFIDIAKSL